MSEAGKYCGKGKKIEEMEDSRKGWHKSFNNLSVHMAGFEKDIGYIKEGIDEIKTNQGKIFKTKVDWKMFLIILALAGTLMGIIWNEISDLADIVSSLK